MIFVLFTRCVEQTSVAVLTEAVLARGSEEHVHAAGRIRLDGGDGRVLGVAAGVAGFQGDVDVEALQRDASGRLQNRHYAGQSWQERRIVARQQHTSLHLKTCHHSNISSSPYQSHTHFKKYMVVIK